MLRIASIFFDVILFVSFILGQQVYKNGQPVVRLRPDDEKVNSSYSFSTSHNFNFSIDHKEHYFEGSTRNSLIYPQSAYQSIGIEAIIPDFQVNEKGGPLLPDQYYPSVAIDNSGNLIFVWIDYRNGDPDVFGLRCAPDGSPLGDIFRVNDDEGSASQFSPSVVVDGSGNFIVIWSDLRKGSDTDIYLQFFASDGTPLGGNFKINDDSSLAMQVGPAIAMDAAGNFIAVWRDDRNGNSDIYAQRFSSDKEKVGSNFKINTDTGTSRQYNPAVAYDKSGNFVVTWTDERNGQHDIYGQRFAADGTTLNDNFKINDNSVDASLGMSSLAFDESNNCMVTWQDNRNGDYDIYAQRYAEDGSVLGNNFRVNDGKDYAWQTEPSVASDDSGHFVIVWKDERNGSNDIYLRRFTTDGVPVSESFKVNNDSGDADQEMAVIAINDSGNCIVAWADNRDGNSDIYAQYFSANGIPLNDNFKVLQDKGSAKQSQPSLTVDNSGKFIVVWEDERNHKYNGDIYLQRYAKDGSLLGDNIKVNDDSIITDHRNPSIAVDGSGDFIVVWDDIRTGSPDIFAQRFAADGTALSRNFKVNDDSSKGIIYDDQFAPSVAVSDSGKLFIAWVDSRNGNGDNDIYAQFYAEDNTPVGKNFRVNDDVGFNMQNGPSVAADGLGHFIVVWTDPRNKDSDIYAQRYASNGAAIGVNFKVNDDSGSESQRNPSVAADVTGNFVVAWTDYRDGYDGNIYAQRFNSDGVALDTNFKVNDDDGRAKQYGASVAIDNAGNFIVEWTDERNGNCDIYAQRFNANGTKIGRNFIVTTETAKDQESPDVKLFNGQIYSVWRSDHSDSHYDIWANVLDWNNPTAIENESNIVITGFRLFQNFPNPFNLRTTIRYTLPNADQVKLTIYNVQGQKIRTLLDGWQPEGQHKISWDGQDGFGQTVPSGVYFYTLKTQRKVQTRKMILLK